MVRRAKDAISFLEAIDAAADFEQLGAVLASAAQSLVAASSACFVPFGVSVTCFSLATVFHERHTREHMLQTVVSAFPSQERELSRAGSSGTQRIFATRRPIVDLNALFRSDGLEAMCCYNEFWRPCNIERQLFAPLSSGERALGFLCLARSASEREFRDAELERAAWLGHHAAHALERVCRDNDDSCGVLEALRHLPCASALFDAAGRLMWISAEAERLLEVQLWGMGRLWSAAAAPRLLEWQRAAEAALRTGTRSVQDGPLLVQRMAGARGPLLLVTQVAARPGQALATLPTGWKLTAREEEVLVELVAGRSNKEIAASLACSARTIEVHVSSLLRKSGCRSRTELLARVWG